MNKKSRAWSMKIKRVGFVSPPTKGRFGGLKRFGYTSIKRLNGKSVLFLSLGMHTGTTASSWTNPPIAPPPNQAFSEERWQ